MEDDDSLVMVMEEEDTCIIQNNPTSNEGTSQKCDDDPANEDQTIYPGWTGIFVL